MRIDVTTPLQCGDLLFQLRQGGERSQAISRIYAGRYGFALNHVGLWTGDAVIEAESTGVMTVPLAAFVAQSVLDNLYRPCVVVCRLMSDQPILVADAVSFARQQIGQPYNDTFGKAGTSWYCSQLIVHAFRYANRGVDVFPETPMSFRDLETGRIHPFWEVLYRARGEPVPEGVLGSHPALLSRSALLTDVRCYGGLPVSGANGFLCETMMLA